MILPKLEIERAEESFAFWRRMACMAIYGCYALLAMEEGESDFDPKAEGDHKKAYSIFQWHLDRVLLMKEGCGIDVRTAGHVDALKAAYYELRHSEHKSWDLLMAAKTLDEAVQIGVIHFERPGNPRADIIKRTAYAEYWQQHFEAQIKFKSKLFHTDH